MTASDTFVAAPKLPKEGDVLVCSWGYDQTNIDYYQVIKVTAAAVRIVRINKKTLPEAPGVFTTNLKVVPVLGSFDPTDKGKSKRVTLDPDGYSVRITSYSHAHLWSGSPNFETKAEFGH